MNTLDKEEFRIKLEEINHLVEKQDYKGAMNVVDSIDWRRVKNVRTLCIVGEIYAANKRYEDSKEIFLLAYHRAPIGKNILYRLIEVSLKMGDVEEAADFYEEFLEVAPNDNMKYVLNYKISKARKDDLDKQIAILEEYKEREFTERWSYELAKLYHQAGYTDKCRDICNEMSIWFNDGKYVAKARKLISYTGEDKEEAAADTAEQKEESTVSASEESVPVIESIRMDQRDINNAESLQEKISKGIREIFNNKKSDEEDQEEVSSDSIPEEIIKDKDTVSAIDYADVPDLEPEEEPEKLKKAENISRKEKESDIFVKKAEPQEIKKLEAEEDLKDRPVKKFEIPEMPDVSIPDRKSEADDISESSEENSPDFNLEDTILAAASAQGIEIPDKEQNDDMEEKGKEESVPDSVSELYEEEDLTEEDLQEAENEFLNGPKKTMETNEEGEENNSTLGVGLNTQAFTFQEEIKKLFGDSDNEEQDDSEEAKLERFIDKMNPMTEEQKRDLIPRQKKFTDNEVKLFTYLAKIPGLKEQVIDTLCDVQMAAADKTSTSGNIIVMGGRECGKTRLISALIPAVCEELHMEASKVAYVYAEQLNGKDITSIVSKLAGGFLVIEKANQMTPEIVEQLDKAMEFRTDGLTVIIEDEKIGMRKLIAKYPKFAKKFTSMINIPVFTNDELVNFAKIYTKENGYTIDQMGMLALYNRISESQKEDEPMNVGSVKEMIDAAIAKSQGGIRKLKRNISKKRTDHDGYIVLYEKDFN